MIKFCLNDKHLFLYHCIIKKNICNLRNGNENSLVDPDKDIVELFKVDNEQIRFSTDGICGIEYLKKYYKNQDWIDVYSIIRRKIIMWPKHSQSINQRRYSCFRDRFDFTIFDIKKFYENGMSKLVIKGSKSEKFLNSLGGFNNFVSEYQLEDFITNKEIINLASPNDDVISSYEDYAFSPEINKKYLEGLVKKLK